MPPLKSVTTSQRTSGPVAHSLSMVDISALRAVLKAAPLSPFVTPWRRAVTSVIFMSWLASTLGQRSDFSRKRGGLIMSAIALHGVGKHWTTAHGVVHALHDLSFELEPGTLNVLLGPSGCGKSTTLRLIAGLESADAGTIVIAGFTGIVRKT